MNLRMGIAGLVIGCITAVLVVGIILSVLATEQFKESTLQRAIDVNANFIMAQAKSQLTQDDFTVNNFDEKEKTFSEFFTGVDTSEIVRIKVWGIDGTILFSNDKSIIGQSFPDNEHFKISKSGTISAEIKDPEKPENIAEKGYGQLMEIYVPIKNNDGTVFGVIETYTSLDQTNNAISNFNSIITLIMIVGVIIIGVIVIIIFSHLQKNAIIPIMKIQNATQKISSGNFDIKIKTKSYDEIKQLSKNVETMAKDLKRQREELKRSEKLTAIGELAARLSHDLRNPLHVIRNSTIMIKEDFKSHLNETAEADFARMDKAIKRMSYQIESVLDFVNIKSLNTTSCSLQEIINSALAKVSKSEDVEIKFSRNNVIVDCDSTKLEVVIENIILNSIQAIDGKGLIQIRLYEDNENAVIEIEDSGPGMTDEVLAKAFDPLFTTKTEGTGLGLATCKNIVEQHGGRIEIKTKPTTFVIKIPKIIKEKLIVTSQ